MTSHLHSLSQSTAPGSSTPSSIVVGNGSLLPVTGTGSTDLSHSFRLNNVLVSPQLIKNLISVHQFTTDNNCSVEFDPAGCSVKDLLSKRLVARCNSSGPLYPLHLPPASSLVAASSASLWHRRLGHPRREALVKLSSVLPACPTDDGSSLCHACQLGRHVRLPFSVSSS